MLAPWEASAHHNASACRSPRLATRPIEQHLLRLRARYMNLSATDHLPRLLDAWLRCATPILREHGRPSFCDGREALIDMDSSVWLAKLRHEQETLCRMLQETPGLERLVRVRGRVREAPVAGPAANPRRSAPPPAAARVVFGEWARHVADPVLKASLARLARPDVPRTRAPVSSPGASGNDAPESGSEAPSSIGGSGSNAGKNQR